MKKEKEQRSGRNGKKGDKINEVNYCICFFWCCSCCCGQPDDCRSLHFLTANRTFNLRRKASSDIESMSFSFISGMCFPPPPQFQLVRFC